MDKILFVATIDQHIRHFHYPFLEWFKKNGYEVHVASNGEEELLYVDKKHNISFERSPFKINNIKAYIQLKKLMEDYDYKLVHCHTPMGGAISRLASISSRKRGLKVLYTAHGFHFYKGAPSMNWLFYYPVEKILSRYTDVLITINEEDYNLAIKKKFKAERIELVHGVGIDLHKFKPQTNQVKFELRNKYLFNEDDFILIYVAELSARKNQEILIKASNRLKESIPKLRLLLVGKGESNDYYAKLIDEFDLKQIVYLMGYRNDVADLMLISDVAVSSSRQEGLPVNIMEAMASGLPIIASDCRGNSDLIKNNRNGFLIDNCSEDGFVMRVEEIYKSSYLRKVFSQNNIDDIDKFSKNKILDKMKEIYTRCGVKYNENTLYNK